MKNLDHKSRAGRKEYWNNKVEQWVAGGRTGPRPDPGSKPALLRQYLAYKYRNGHYADVFMEWGGKAKEVKRKIQRPEGEHAFEFNTEV